MSDGQANSSKLARRRPFLSIRARLIVLALLAIAPLMLARLHELENARQARMKAVNTDVIDLARRGVESQREIIYSVRALLQVVSRVYARIPLDTSGCNQYIADLAANIPWIRDLSVATTDGRIKCSTEPLAIGLDVSDRPHFRNALNSREFGLSDYLINRLNHLPSLVAAFPVIKDDGVLKGVALAVINLQWIGDLAATAAQHSGASVTIERAAALAEEARKAVEDLLINHSEAPCGHVTVSIGVESMVPDKFQTAADLVEAADNALYAAKRRGRNTVVARIPALLRAAS